MKRLLFISHRLPYPPDKGERLRAYQQLKALSGRYEITLACPVLEQGEYQAAECLREFCRTILLAPAGGKAGLVRGSLSLLGGGSVTQGYYHSSQLRRLVRQESARKPFDLVFGYCSAMLPLVLAAQAKARVMDLVDADSAKWRAYARSAGPPKRWLLGLEGRRVATLERRALEQCQAAFIVTAAEKAALGIAGQKVHPIGNGVDLNYFRREAVVEGVRGNYAPSLVFTGTMSYRPNIEGVCWFAREVWPRLHQGFAELEFYVVGRDPAAEVRELAALPGVTVTGTVKDVRPYLAKATAAVAPLHIARGIQNKVLEAMAMSLPVVATGPALEGLDVTAGGERPNVVRADTAAEFRTALLGLLLDETGAKRIGQAARRCVETRYSWDAQLAPMLELCEQAMAGAAAGTSTAQAGAAVGDSPARGQP